MSKILSVVIDAPYWGAWKKFGWEKGTWGVGIKKQKVEAAKVAGYDLFKISVNKAQYFISPEFVETYALENNSIHKAKQGVTLYVVPCTELRTPLGTLENKQPEGEGDNMQDTFRKEYKPLTDEQKVQMANIKNAAESLLLSMNEAVPADERSERSRCMAIARTNLETAIMWAIKGVTA